VGTARTGIAVLRDGRLIDRGIHNYPDAWSGTKLHVILSRYERYVVRRGVDAIVVKVPPLRKHTPRLTAIIEGIGALAAKHRCTFDIATKSEIKRDLGLRSTAQLIGHVRGLYPEVAAQYDRGRKNAHEYYARLYEAIICARLYGDRQQLLAHST
jgi:hypothetical protein